MDDSRIAIIVLLAGHVTCSVLVLYHLFMVSKRTAKSLWTVFILVVPYLGVFIYTVTMRGSGRPASPGKPNV